MPDTSSATNEQPRPAEVWAWLSAGGRTWHAGGEVSRTALPAEGGVSFYVNDFALSDAEPWRAPASEALALSVPVTGTPEVLWEPPVEGAFREVFDELMGAVRRREILKAVPVAAAAGRVLTGEAGAWLRHV